MSAKSAIVTVTFHFAALHYLNLWLATERAVHETLMTGDADQQLNALKTGATNFRIARNLPTKYDEGEGLPRYGPVLEVLSRVTAADFIDDLTGRIIQVRDQLSARYGKREVLSATTKLLWLKIRSPIIIYDRQARQALNAPSGDLAAYYRAWQRRYDSSRTQITEACGRLVNVLEYTIDSSVTTEAYVRSLATEEWFHQRVFDIYLWHVGSK